MHFKDNKKFTNLNFNGTPPPNATLPKKKEGLIQKDKGLFTSIVSSWTIPKNSIPWIPHPPITYLKVTTRINIKTSIG